MIDGQTRVVSLRDLHAENIMYLDNRLVQPLWDFWIFRSFFVIRLMIWSHFFKT